MLGSPLTNVILAMGRSADRPELETELCKLLAEQVQHAL